MGVTQILMTEHRLIEQVLTCAERMTNRAKAEGSLDKLRAEKVIDFIRNFADHAHHLKEENHLFKLLEQRGFSPHQGPTAVMRQEHDFGRNCVKQMADSLQSAASGDKVALAKFAENAILFAEMLRAHIQKEDTRLYPMANNILSNHDQETLMVAFNQVDEQEAALGNQQKYLAIAEELANYYGVEKADLSAVQDCGGDMGCGGCGG